nr:hypothetical protein [Rhabdothermincola salaria]
MVLLAACSSSSDDGGGDGTTTTTVPAVEPVDFSGPGPYEVGTTTIDMGDRVAYVFYPADAAATAEAEVVDGYSSAVAFPEAVRAVMPEQFVQDIPLDAYRDVAPSPDGPFPVIIHSHGFGGYAAYASQHFEHMASWGFVTASPEHVERDLAASALGTVERGADVEVLRATYAELEEADAGGLLAGSMDLDQLAVEGHSAGGSAVMSFAADPEVKTVIGQAPGPGVDVDPEAPDREAALTAAYADATPPDKPSMILAGEVDATIPLTSVDLLFDWLAPPKRYAVLAAAGHNAFTDLCAPIRAQGGLTQFAGTLPVPDQLLELGEDGCTEGDLEPELGYRIIDHLTVAQLRDVFGIDAEVAAASLEQAWLEELFPGALARYEYVP